MDDNIDFVLLWVDGNDAKWQEDFKKYAPLDSKGDKQEVRFRDWNNLNYWFRAIEECAPWVNKIHFVTSGHLPKWLNVNHPKINIVKHKEIFIDQSFLPTFNSRAIEINIHRIPGLANKFVYFNDDTFLLKRTKPTRFFSNGKPVDLGIMNAISTNALAHVLLQNINIINKYFCKYRMIKEKPFKWFNIKYGTKLYRNIALLPWSKYTGFYDPHQPVAYLRSTFEEVWLKESELLKSTCKARFKCDGNINQYLFRYWQLAKGIFKATGAKDFKMIELLRRQDCIKAAKLITSRKCRLLCINDRQELYNFSEAQVIVNEALCERWPQKCSYEL